MYDSYKLEAFFIPLLQVRIARRDGTSDYVEGALEQPWYGTIVLGLYGKEAPLSVAKFLKYVDSRPNFKRSQFYRLLPGSLVEGGRIAGMTTANLAGPPVACAKGVVLLFFFILVQSLSCAAALLKWSSVQRNLLKRGFGFWPVWRICLHNIIFWVSFPGDRFKSHTPGSHAHSFGPVIRLLLSGKWGVRKWVGQTPTKKLCA